MSTLLSPVDGDQGYAHFREQFSSNTSGGTFTQGAWRIRTLNTSVENTIPGASLSSNEFTLPAGTYDIRWAAPAVSCNAHLSRLWNVTGSSSLALAQAALASSASTQMIYSLGQARITLGSTTVIRVEHWCQTTRATNGFGIPTNLDSQNEIYTEVYIWKV